MVVIIEGYLIHNTMKQTFRTNIIAPGHQCERMGEEGGRKPSLDNPEYFLFPEDPAAMDRNPENPATMDRNPGNPAPA